MDLCKYMEKLVTVICEVLYILTCVCYVVSEVLHNASIHMCNNPDIEVHTVCMVYGGKTECAIIMSIHAPVCVSAFSK